MSLSAEQKSVSKGLSFTFMVRHQVISLSVKQPTNQSSQMVPEFRQKRYVTMVLDR